MPNLMLTYRCNLRCPYCFANEFVNRDKTDITIRNFLKAVSFITRDGTSDIGLIGGEPTLHPGFGEIMDLLIANPKVRRITLYTNGLLLDRFIPQVTNPKVRMLVNCNSPAITGEEGFDRVKRNLDELFLKHGMKGRLKLGINLYREDMDYSYIMELLPRYGLERLRISVAVPDFSAVGETDVLEYFKKQKPFLMRFFRDMDSIHVLPHYDCNHPPFCIWTEEEREWLQAYVARYPESNGNLAEGSAMCVPAIDILPNLQAVRCFGMSDFLKVPIEEFDCAEDLRRYFLSEIDSVAVKLAANEACGDCYGRKTGYCYAGCLGFKASRIKACNEAIGRL